MLLRAALVSLLLSSFTYGIGGGEIAADEFQTFVGHDGDCSGTIVSPPDSPTTVLLTAAHCTLTNTFRVANTRYNRAYCVANPLFRNHLATSPAHDVALCFSPKPSPGTKLYGCLNAVSLGAGHSIFAVGYGRPDASPPQFGDRATIGKMKIGSVGVADGKISASEGATLLKGDSGGPVFAESEILRKPIEGPIAILGVNSGNDRETKDRVFPLLREKGNFQFFKDALAKYATVKYDDEAAPEAKICGVNFQPPANEETRLRARSRLLHAHK